MTIATLRRGAALVALILLLSPAASAAQTVTLGWDPSSGAVGYRVRWGTTSGTYTHSADAGTATSYTLPNLVPGGTYYVVVQAYNGSNFSSYSAQLAFTVPGVCAFSINPASISISPASASGTIFVTTQSGCAWSASSTSGFIAFSNGTGRSGPGSLGFTVAANTTTSTRTGLSSVAGQTFSVSQMGLQPSSTSGLPLHLSNDFDADGKNDLIVQDLAAGNVEAWLMDGTTVKGVQRFNQQVNDRNWMIVGRGDFNADSKPDIVWQHRTGGYVYIWFMDGTTQIGGSYLSIDRVADPQWRVAGIGDFNADGKPDLLWQHRTTGSLATWLTDGTSVLGALSLIPDRTLDPLWEIAGVADFNADGKSDLLWRHRGHGDVGVWFMSGVSRLVYAPLLPTSVKDQKWQIAAVTDLDADGRPDIVWQHTDGWAAVWYMNGTTRLSNPSISSVVPRGWAIVGPK